MSSLFILLLFLAACAQAQTQRATEKSVYEERAQHDPDGIGRFYFGREIAHVMGHQGAGWLERPDREQTELPDQVVAQMELKPNQVVGDIGAGTGYFTFRLSARVPQGKIYAVDIQPEMLSIITTRRKTQQIENIVTVQGTETDVRLPENMIDAVLLVDAYHEFSYPREMMESIVKSLKPGGRVILIEYRGEDPEVPIKRVHKMTVAQARREMEAVGLIWKETKNFLPSQHFIVFAKPEK
jgi:ubiquinone/menaquinone biosynthesis C-methylase UbiE